MQTAQATLVPEQKMAERAVFPIRAVANIQKKKTCGQNQPGGWSPENLIASCGAGLRTEKNWSADGPNRGTLIKLSDISPSKTRREKKRAEPRDLEKGRRSLQKRRSENKT